jgi:hypothetical protein
MRESTLPPPNNTIPASAIDATSARMVPLYPQPNLVGTTTFCITRCKPITSTSSIRADYRTDKSAIFGRFRYEDPDTFNPGNLPEPGIWPGTQPYGTCGGSEQTGRVRVFR